MNNTLGFSVIEYIMITLYIIEWMNLGPGGLHTPPVVADGSVAGHC